MVYPALLPTIKTYDKLPSSMASRELSNKSRQLVVTNCRFWRVIIIIIIIGFDCASFHDAEGGQLIHPNRL
jgi:hypothetical protein